MAVDPTDGFQDELVSLFVEEAREWLQNIHVALDELQQGPPPETHAKLIATITAGVTNLGGSAATINLPDVERASFGALPFIDALKDPAKTLSVQDFLALCKQLGQIHTALTGATGISFEDDGSAAEAAMLAVTISPADFLQGLEQLQATPVSAAGRSLVRTLVEQMKGQVQAGVERVDVSVIHGFLQRVEEAEESFLKQVDDRLPVLTDRIASLSRAGASTKPMALALESSLKDVAQLRTDAQQVNAGMAMTFFAGLQSFLTVVLHQQVLVAAGRVESVKTRLQGMRGAIHQWVEQGRTERAAIGGLLPASSS
jgi:chemotaxis protein histidine kinase CheA